MNREPAIIVGAVVGVIEALVVALVTTGALDLGTDETGAIVAAVAAIGAAVQALWTRSRVYAPATVEELQEV